VPRSRDDLTPSLFGPGDARSQALDRVPRVEPPHDEAALASAMPGQLRMGTSSWSFPGWRGLLFQRDHTETDLARFGLGAYSSHPLFRTVSLDRLFYAPMTEAALAELGAQVGDGFRFVAKAHNALTRPLMDERMRPHHSEGDVNPLFLDAGHAVGQVIGPVAMGLGVKAGPIVFQLPPLKFAPRGPVGTADGLIDRLGEFFTRINERAAGARAKPHAWSLALEVRNHDFFQGEHVKRYAQMLASAGVSHTFAWHPGVPAVGEQVRLLREAGLAPATNPAIVVRWLLRHELAYDDAKDRYRPFNAIRDPDEPARRQIARLILDAIPTGLDIWVAINNKAEGSAPRTVVLLAQLVEELMRRAAARAAEEEIEGTRDQGIEG